MPNPRDYVRRVCVSVINVVHVRRIDHPLPNLDDIHTYLSPILMCMLATICFHEASQATVHRARDTVILSCEHSCILAADV